MFGFSRKIMLPANKPSRLSILIAEKLSRPDEWMETEYIATHTATGLAIWIANKDYGLEIKHPHRFTPSELDRKYIWNAYLNSGEAALVRLLEAA